MKAAFAVYVGLLAAIAIWTSILWLVCDGLAATCPLFSKRQCSHDGVATSTSNLGGRVESGEVVGEKKLRLHLRELRKCPSDIHTILLSPFMTIYIISLHIISSSFYQRAHVPTLFCDAVGSSLRLLRFLGRASAKSPSLSMSPGLKTPSICLITTAISLASLCHALSALAPLYHLCCSSICLRNSPTDRSEEIFPSADAPQQQQSLCPVARIHFLLLLLSKEMLTAHRLSSLCYLP